MSNSSSLVKTIFHKTVAEAVYNEILSKTAKYYYFLGKVLTWADETTPPVPVDNVRYERDTRNQIATLKLIQPNDVSFVVNRIDWIANTVYDQYDDQYCTQVLGINLISGGDQYLSVPNVTIDPPDQAGGIQATATAIIYQNSVVGFTITNPGLGYTNPPNVYIVDPTGVGSGATAMGTIGVSSTGVFRLEDSKFYVITDEYNVYKCLDNNNGALSTIKPIGTSTSPIPLSDGYIWKYLFNVPIALRTKFLTDTQFPVVTALNQQYYSNGGINAVTINNFGSGYTAAQISVQGDGYLASDPVFLSSVTVNNPGTGYSDGDTITVSPPVTSVAIWVASSSVYLGNIIQAGNNYYKVVQAGQTSSVSPSHTSGIVQNGTAALQFVGQTVLVYPTFTGSTITSVNLLGGVKDVVMSTFGNGYTTTPTVTFSPPTLPFTASSSSVVNVSTETITVGPHWFVTGTPVTYNAQGNTAIGGLTTNTQYFVIKVSSTAIKLATTQANALAGTAINLTSLGAGTQSFDGAGHFVAQGIANLNSTNGAVKSITITNIGQNYASVPTVTIGTPWTASTAVTYGQQYFVSNRLYTVTSAGTTGSTAPTGASLGTAYTDGTAQLTYVGAAASGTCELRYGYGYSGNPTVTINTTTGSAFSASFSSTKSEAKLIPLVTNGQIDNVQIDDPGIGYSTAVITVTGNGTGSSISPNISIGNIENLQANTELLATPGTIDNIPVLSGGYGYGGSPIITIDGDGTGATAVASTSNGKVTKITVVNPGFGYTYANITITGNGYGAVARAVISPYDGDSKNAYKELFATTLMFYSNVSLDTNQGFTVNNAYRQVGIIKNPYAQGTTNIYNANLGSACWVIGGTYNASNFLKDQILTIPRTVTLNNVTYTDQKQYVIVAVDGLGKSMLVSSLNNDTPLVGDVMTNPSNQQFSISAVGAPTVDKYTGEVLFIDNLVAFTPSSDEAVTMRTAISF